MSEPIKVGDLVAVVKPTLCCGNPKILGMIFRVSKLKAGGISCAHCGTLFSEGLSAVLRETSDEWHGVTLSRLKRIPPLSELEDEKNKEELTA